MKKNLTRTMITAVVVALGAAAAYAQSNMTANIPFDFQTRGVKHAAGRYTVGSATSSHASGLLRIQSVKTGETAYLGVGTPSGLANDNRPRLVFKCVGGNCALAEVWGDNGRSYMFATPRVMAGDLERVAVIFVDRKDAE